MASEAVAAGGFSTRITTELAQPIVDRAIAILHRNINIMDENGIIVGSGDPTRVGTFHEGAALAIATGRPQEVHPEDTQNLEGVRPGVNLPILLEGHLAGVIGITGPPVEVRPFGELIREMAQLMLAQARTAEVERVAELAREALLRELLIDEVHLSDRMEREAGVLGIVPDAEYQVLLCSPEILPAPGEYAWFRSLSRTAAEAARKAGAAPVVTAGPWDGHLVVVAGRSPSTLAAALYGALPPGTTVAAGLVRVGLRGLRTSYKTALAAHTTGHRLHGAGLYAADDLVLETMLASVDPTRAARCVEQALAKLPPAGTAQGRVARETIAVYLRQGMSRARAADALGIHRHTLIYRLDQIAATTGLDPRRWEDGFELYLALLLERLFIRPVQ